MSFGGGNAPPSPPQSRSPSSRELQESIAKLDTATERLRASTIEAAAEAASGPRLGSKFQKFQAQVDDIEHTVEDLCASVAVEKELKAAKSLREEKAAIRKKAMDEEAAAERRYNEAMDKAQLEAEVEVAEKTLRARRVEEERIQRLKEDLEARRKAREAAELVYSSDLATTLRRLRELELDLENSRASVSSAYERRRLHDALRRIRSSRLSLGEQVLDYDYRGRRLGSLLESPALYTGLASRAYDYYPYSRYSRSYYPYSTYYDYACYGYPYSSYYSSYYRDPLYPYLY